MEIGIDFGSSVTDAVLVDHGAVLQHASFHRPGPASVTVLRRALEALGPRAEAVTAIGISGGQSRSLPPRHGSARLVSIDEPEAVGRGGLALSGRARAFVVSCGTGTAMVVADAAEQRFEHVTGTAVGGGTLEGLGTLALGLHDASAVAELALRGDASAVVAPR